MKHDLVRPPDRPKLQPIIHDFRVATNTAQDTLYKIHEKIKHDPVRPPERPKLQPNTLFSVFCAPGSEMNVNHTNILFSQIKLPHKF
ncbi:hypothetical protein KSS87_002021 [Heliosperma pusillum]|nr:hypothetical protein KSS87_002021 [Heliosperma pusillum]